MASHNELLNFVTKFTHLWNAGKAAHLVIDCKAGEATVSLSLSLGRHLPTTPGQGHHQRRPGPSRLRRRERRAHARAEAAANAALSHSDVAVQAAIPTVDAAVQAVPATAVATGQAAVQAGPPAQEGLPRYRPPQLAAPPSLSPIPQLDGSTDRDFPKKCKVCQKSLETRDDVSWHLESKYGREDCRILKSMLQF